jgi:hypothetical protein
MLHHFALLKTGFTVVNAISKGAQSPTGEFALELLKQYLKTKVPATATGTHYHPCTKVH